MEVLGFIALMAVAKLLSDSVLDGLGTMRGQEPWRRKAARERRAQRDAVRMANADRAHERDMVTDHPYPTGRQALASRWANWRRKDRSEMGPVRRAWWDLRADRAAEFTHRRRIRDARLRRDRQKMASWWDRFVNRMVDHAADSGTKWWDRHNNRDQYGPEPVEALDADVVDPDEEPHRVVDPPQPPPSGGSGAPPPSGGPSTWVDPDPDSGPLWNDGEVVRENPRGPVEVGGSVWHPLRGRGTVLGLPAGTDYADVEFDEHPGVEDTVPRVELNSSIVNPAAPWHRVLLRGRDGSVDEDQIRGFDREDAIRNARANWIEHNPHGAVASVEYVEPLVLEAGTTADAAWLAEQFEFELCHNCGGDADRHQVSLGPGGEPHAVCLSELVATPLSSDATGAVLPGQGWQEDPQGLVPAGDVGGDEQDGDAMSRRWIRPTPGVPGHWSVLTSTHYPAISSTTGERYVGEQVERLVVTDLNDLDTAVWSETDYEDLSDDREVTPELVRQFALNGAVDPTDGFGWDGLEGAAGALEAVPTDQGEPSMTMALGNGTAPAQQVKPTPIKSSQTTGHLRADQATEYAAQIEAWMRNAQSGVDEFLRQMRAEGVSGSGMARLGRISTKLGEAAGEAAGAKGEFTQHVAIGTRTRAAQQATGAGGANYLGIKP